MKRLAAIGAVLLANAANGQTVIDSEFLAGGLRGGRVVSDLVVFGGDKQQTGNAIWETDGTSVNLLNDPNPGVGTRVDLSDSVMLAGVLYFAADDGTNGCELWETDATTLGTRIHFDINPGTGGSLDDGSDCLLDEAETMGSGFVFTADNGTNGREPWFCNGSGSCALLSDISSGASDSNSEDYTALSANEVIFSAEDGVNGLQVWRTDGTPGGTSVACNDSFIQLGPFETIDGEGYFSADDGMVGRELWKYTPGAGCSLVLDIRPGVLGSIGVSPCFRACVVVGSTIYFVADDGTTGCELWQTDGTTLGTSLVRDISPMGASSTFCGDRFDLEELDGQLFFLVDDGTHGCEPWRSDGTVAGTQLIRDLNPGATGSVVDPSHRIKIDPSPSLQSSAFAFETILGDVALSQECLSQCTLTSCQARLCAVDENIVVLADGTVPDIANDPLEGLLVIGLEDRISGNVDIVTIPEPSSSAVLMVACASILALRQGRRRSTSAS